MTYKQWEAELLKYLDNIPECERRDACEYYREIFQDKFDAGIGEEKILEEFGSARTCAGRILCERADDLTSYEKTQTPLPSAVPAQEKRQISISKWVGIFFLTTLVVIPFASAMISVIAAFGSVAITGAAMIISGVIGTLVSPFALILGYTGWGVVGAAGTCLAVAGVGMLILPIFYIITKYCIIASLKLAKYAIGRLRK